jgi:hypothetical protein
VSPFELAQRGAEEVGVQMPVAEVAAVEAVNRFLVGLFTIQFYIEKVAIIRLRENPLQSALRVVQTYHGPRTRAELVNL